MTDFLKRNVGAVITLIAGVLFLVLRLAFPAWVAGQVADVMLLIALPLLVVGYLTLYKVEKHNEELIETRERILSTLGYSFQTFPTAPEVHEYYRTHLAKSKTVHDLTWAEVNSSNSANDEEIKYFVDQLTPAKEVTEVFIFKVAGVFRQDRVAKLKAVVAFIKGGGKCNYSCACYEETKFERLQFTVFDESTAVFTSSYTPRVAIREATLVQILMKYYQQSWKDAQVLIEHGKIVNAKGIEDIINAANA